MSNDLRTVEPWAKKILLNTDVIAISQDRLGVQVRPRRGPLPL